MTDSQIDSAEDVARVLFYPSFFSGVNTPLYSDGVLSPTAFKLQILKSGTPESSISVLRTILECFTHDLAKLSPRSHSDYKCGYALLNVGQVRGIRIPSNHNIDIEVIPSASKRMPSHAEIVFRLDGEVVTANEEPIEIIRFRKKLARMASSRIVRL
ncbi:MAG: hypothetical protein IJ618_08055 [Prevotella sp.]|nr:hypothetical protein [Prevotella sp.]